MNDRRMAAFPVAITGLIAVAAALGGSPAEARRIAGMEISDCVPGARICSNGVTRPEPTGERRFVRARMCRAKASRAPFPEDRPMIFAVCMRS